MVRIENGHTESFNVIIVGGGPAGCAAALSYFKHSRYTSCLIIDNATPDAFKIGESLPPEASRVLHYIHPSLALKLRKGVEIGEHLPCTGNASSWATSTLEERHAIMNPFGHGFHLDRAAFDEMFRETIVDVSETHSRLKFVKCSFNSIHKTADQRWSVQADSEDGGQVTFTADWVVDATGRKAAIATKLGARAVSPQPLLAFYALFIGPSATDATEGDNDKRTLIEAIPEGWLYSSLLSREPSARIVVFHTLPTHPSAKRVRKKDGFMDLLQGSASHIWNVIETCDYTMSKGYPRCTAAGSSYLDKPCNEEQRWLAVGDAAMAFDPLSSQGMMTALEMGVYVGSLLAERTENSSTILLEPLQQKVEEMYRLVQDDYVRHRDYYYGIVKRFEGHSFWESILDK